MIHKFLSKYGLATHLALLTAVPLALTPFLAASALASVVFWLSGLAAIWLLVNPSIRPGEYLSNARSRVRFEILRDPLFWFLLVALLYALIRMLNAEIALRYDPEQAAWQVKDPAWPSLPASVPGQGVLPFAVLVALSVVTLSLRHGVGLLARTEFGVAASLLTGLGGLAAVACACAGFKPYALWMNSGVAEAPFWASCFGVWLLVAVVSGVQAETCRWAYARLPLILGTGGNASALIFFAPPLAAVLWLALGFLVVAFAFVSLGRTGSKGQIVRCLSLMLLGLAIPLLLLMMFMPEDVRVARANMLDPALAFSESYHAMCVVFSRISREIWLSHPWLGAGVGAYGLHVPFIAEKADWVLIPAQPSFAPNGYWMFLAERGIVGCLLLSLGLGLLLCGYVARLVGAWRGLCRQTDADIFPFAVQPMVWLAPLALVLLAVEAVWSPLFTNPVVLLTGSSVLALSAASFPKEKRMEADAAASSEEILES